jgi:hypothetical protein
MNLPQYVQKTSATDPKQIRLLLVGPPKYGKTWASTTFPNPIFLDIDNSFTSAELSKMGLNVIPLHDPAFRKKHWPADSKLSSCVVAAIKDLASKLDGTSTIVLDSMSSISNVVEDELWLRVPVGKDGKPDGYAFWEMWADWWCGLCILMTQYTCHFVLTAHEAEIRDGDNGKIVGYRWLLPGQKFSPNMSSYFTDVFRQTRETKETGIGLTRTVQDVYMWQVRGDSKYNYCCTRMKTDKMFLPATYKSFDLYK